MKENESLTIALYRIVGQEVNKVLEKIRAEIKTKYDGIPWRDSEYNDGRIEALEWVYDDVISKYIKEEYKEEYEPD